MLFAVLFVPVGAAEIVWTTSGPARAVHTQVAFNAMSAPSALTVAATLEPRKPVDQLGKGVFLIASEKLIDPNFSQTVVLLIDYDQSGALGLIVNRPSGIPLSQALPELEILEKRQDTVFFGGPVGRNQLFLLVRSSLSPPDASLVVEDVYASVSLETLRRLMSDGDPEPVFHAHAGYSGWGPGQLDNEVLRGDWYVTPADALTIFDQPAEEIWPNLIKKHRGVWVFRTPSGSLVTEANCDWAPADLCR